MFKISFKIGTKKYFSSLLLLRGVKIVKHRLTPLQSILDPLINLTLIERRIGLTCLPGPLPLVLLPLILLNIVTIK